MDIEFTFEELEVLESVLTNAILDGFSVDDSDPIVTSLNKIAEVKELLETLDFNQDS